MRATAVRSVRIVTDVTVESAPHFVASALASGINGCTVPTALMSTREPEEIVVVVVMVVAVNQPPTSAALTSTFPL